MSNDFEYIPRARPARPERPTSLLRLGCTVFVAVLAAILVGACLLSNFDDGNEYMRATVKIERVGTFITTAKQERWELIERQPANEPGQVELGFRRPKTPR